MFFRQILFTAWAIIPFVCFANVSSGNITTPCFPLFSEKDNQWIEPARRDLQGNGDSRRSFSLYKPDLEAAINKQINIELFAHYTYLSMAYHFDHNKMKMEGFHKYFLKMAQEEHEHAQMFMKYQNKRGGRVQLQPIQKPCQDGNWGNGLDAMRKALDLENAVNIALTVLHGIGKDDAQFQDFLESNFLGEQVESIKELNDYVNILQRLNSALGEYQFDKTTLQGKA